MTTLTKKKAPGDLVIHVESLEYCTVLASLRNDATVSVTVTSVLGAPVKAGGSGADFIFAKSTEEANVVGLVMDGPEPLVLAGSSNSAKKYQVLKNPPAIINKDLIKTTDPQGVAFDTLAEIVISLEALKFEVRTQPVKETVQST